MASYDQADDSQSYLNMYRPDRVSSLQARAQNARDMRAARNAGAARPTPRPSQRNPSPSPLAGNHRRTNTSNTNSRLPSGNRKLSASKGTAPPPPPIDGEEDDDIPAPPPQQPIIMNKNTPRTVYYYTCEHTETKIGEGKAGSSPLKLLKKRPCDSCLVMLEEEAARKKAVKKDIGRGRDGRLGIVREKR